LHYVDSSRPGGIESHLAGLLPALRAAGVDARLLLHADHGPHPLRDQLAATGVPHATLSGGFSALVARLRAERPVLLHTHGYKAGLLGRAARLFGGPPVVSTMHSGDLGTGRVRLYNSLDAATARLARLIAVSPALQARFPGATLIANGVALPPDPMPPGDAIAFVGRFAEEKGPEVFAALARRFPDRRFVAFGDGPLHAAVAASAPPNLSLRGSVPSMAPHWAGIGLLVMPSRFEGLPMAALEAMARRVPVAAFAVGALPDLLGESHGFLAPPGDLDGLAAQIARWGALDVGARRALEERARARIAADYGVQACAHATIALYTDVAGGGVRVSCAV
jgi:glycosyltransferase involved in cell wall biosynthesis